MPRTPALPSSHRALYNTDFVLWVDQTVNLLKQGRLNELDIENLIEEIEDLGRSQKQALVSNLRVVLMHLLKWQYQTSKRTRSWEGSILEHRLRIDRILEDSPSLRSVYPQIFAKTYQQARKVAAVETGLDISIFPTECPYTTEQVLDQDFLSGE